MHLALVTTKRVLIDYEYMDHEDHFPGWYFFGTTSGVTWQSRALTGAHSRSVKFRLQNSRKPMGALERAQKSKHFSCKNHGLEINISPSMKTFRICDVTGPNTRGTLSTENRKMLGVIIFEGN